MVVCLIFMSATTETGTEYITAQKLTLKNDPVLLPASGEKGEERVQHIYRRKTACPSAAELIENAGEMDRDIEKYRHSVFFMFYFCHFSSFLSS